MTTFTVTAANQSALPRQFRPDLDASQQLEIQNERKMIMRRDNHRQAAGSGLNKDAHRKALLMLIAEVDRFHATCTHRLVSCPGVPQDPREVPTAGLSLPTLKALVTDVDIVMNDEDKDNYQHALSAVASLALWQA